MGKTMLEEALDEHYAREVRLAGATKPLLEPAVAEAELAVAANLSLAISMKRIADVVTNPAFIDAVMLTLYPAMKVEQE